jgi:general secretion pathway protein G
MKQSKKAFTMIELVFVIVIIGILAAVAVPRLAATRDDAIITKTRVLVASIKSAVSMERQKRILRGNFDPIFRLTNSSTLDKRIFNLFDGVANADILENPPFSCKVATDKNCWRETQTGTLALAKNRINTDDSQYTYNFSTGGSIVFRLNKNKFECVDENSDSCKLLTQ